MPSVYRTTHGRAVIADWCVKQLDAWTVPHTRSLLPTSAGHTHLTAAGVPGGPVSVLVVPGTNFNAATSLPLATALANHWPVHVADLPGQPGLSAPDRPRRDHTDWYAAWLSEVCTHLSGPLVMVGHSLGGAIALACDSPHIAGRVLIAPAGLAA
ncbi:alpha/beta fold hydrolase [Longispora sp. NPDC051575]|uniref:alpha/beta hydrolase n=1 Tax=Longispora sp. NPDC051575 TaxID=3154943 RepID=UPI0034459827